MITSCSIVYFRKLTDNKKYFGTARRKYVDIPLNDFGFKPYKTSYLARMTADKVFQFVYFHKYRFGGQFTVEIAIRPLYCPHDEYLTLLPGNRLYTIATNGKSDKWWKHETESETDESFKNVFQLIKDHAIPFFDATTTSSGIISSYKRNFLGRNRFGKRICWGTTGWENFDFAHIYLRSGDKRNALRQITKAYKDFICDDRDWAQTAAMKCLEIKQIINASASEVDAYLERIIKSSKQSLGLEQW